MGEREWRWKEGVRKWWSGGWGGRSGGRRKGRVERGKTHTQAVCLGVCLHCRLIPRAASWILVHMTRDGVAPVSGHRPRRVRRAERRLDCVYASGRDGFTHTYTGGRPSRSGFPPGAGGQAAGGGRSADAVCEPRGGSACRGGRLRACVARARIHGASPDCRSGEARSRVARQGAWGLVGQLSVKNSYKLAQRRRFTKGQMKPTSRVSSTALGAGENRQSNALVSSEDHVRYDALARPAPRH